ncbi:WYL domain-containing protein (plasmid) [Cereibacter sphaeroides f. sp. denitrificans]
MRLNVPAVEIIATLTRAIVGGAAVRVVYHSLTSGRTVREIAPHALVDTAARWHVRAYDCCRLRFSDFVLTRIEDAESASGATSPRELREADDQWMRMVELDLVPHPALARSEPVERGLRHDE